MNAKPKPIRRKILREVWDLLLAALTPRSTCFLPFDAYPSQFRAPMTKPAVTFTATSHS